jgi:hypothetical protein
VDVRLAAYLNSAVSSNPLFTKQPLRQARLKRIAWGKYSISGHIINLRTVNGSLIARIGGGWMAFDKLLEHISQLKNERRGNDDFLFFFFFFFWFFDCC